MTGGSLSPGYTYYTGAVPATEVTKAVAKLALAIVDAVVAACAPRGVPVTLKMRTGWCASARNAPRIARAAQEAGIALLTVHGRTREQGYKGFAEHDTVAAIKRAVRGESPPADAPLSQMRAKLQVRPDPKADDVPLTRREY